MIGPKKLSTIREEVRRALAEAAEGDPIAWLEQRITAAAPTGVAGAERDEVLQSLRRILEAPIRKKRSKRRATAGKWGRQQ
jgi:hypothetical protein